MKRGKLIFYIHANRTQQTNQNKVQMSYGAYPRILSLISKDQKEIINCTMDDLAVSLPLDSTVAAFTISCVS